MSAETSGGRLAEPEAVGSPEADDAGAISASPSRGVSRCRLRAESSVSSRPSSMRTTLAVIQSGVIPSIATVRFHGRTGREESCAIAGNARAAGQKLQKLNRVAQKNQSRSCAETSSQCKAVGSSSETKHHAWPHNACKSDDHGEMEHMGITYESHERLQVDNTKEAGVILTARR